MSATSPSPQKRPSLAQRSSSAHSLSSGGRPANPNKGHKVNVMNKHARNLSHGKGLNRLGKVASNANVVADGKHHQRKKSGPVTPTESPRTSVSSNIKRNSSHVALTKNTSHTSLRKNHSAGALSGKRNRSHGALMKLGAQPSQKQESEQKQGFFALGDQSSEEDDEEEWEDSATQSPELSRDQSKASTPLRPRTPNGDNQRSSDAGVIGGKKLTQPPEALADHVNNRSAPNLRQTLTEHHAGDPTLLPSQSRSSRAPPAMSTVSAQVVPSKMQRTDSIRSLTTASQITPKTPDASNGTPGVGTASSGSGGVSHFLPSTSVATSVKTFETGSDEESASSFIANYKPQISDSPERPRSMLNKIQPRTTPSRTNQRMELQRRENMRVGATAASSTGPGSLGLRAGSGVSLHSRSGSKAGGRNRSLAGEMKAMKQDYHAAVRQLTVVRRFRNPVLESLHRLQDNNVISSDAMSRSQPGSQAKATLPNRRSVTVSAAQTPKTGIARSAEDKKGAPTGLRPDGSSRPGRVQFQISRQASHDDIGLTTSQGSPGEFDDEQDGVSPEEALIRRIWDARIVFENDGVQQQA